MDAKFLFGCSALAHVTVEPRVSPAFGAFLRHPGEIRVPNKTAGGGSHEVGNSWHRMAGIGLAKSRRIQWPLRKWE